MKSLSEQKGKIHCDGCDALVINGIACHETGCPDEWRDPKECKECGLTFTPEDRYQQCCDHTCSVAWNGLLCQCGECEANRQFDMATKDEIEDDDSNEIQT